MESILLDGVSTEITGTMTLGDLLPDMDQSTVIGVIRPGTFAQETTRNLQIKTTSGEIVVEMLADPTWILKITGPPLHYADRNSAAFGPFVSDLAPERRPHLYERGDLILGCVGYNPTESHLVFSRTRHTADHGAAVGGGVIGRVVSGRGVLDRWTSGDHIEAISPILSWADTSRSFTTHDSTLLLEDGMAIITHIEVTAEGYDPDGISTRTATSVEHLLLALDSGHLTADRVASTHLRDERMAGSQVPSEHTKGRREGTVTVRTRGSGSGCIYIYKEDVPGIASHTVVGQVTHGLELIKLAKARERIAIQVTPSRFDMLGRSLDEAISSGEARGLKVTADSEEPDRVVIDQTPPTTLEVLAAGEVAFQTVPLSQVIDLILDDQNAPDSTAIFRRLTGLFWHDIGTLPLFFTFEDVFLFKPKIPTGVLITPENIPVERAPAAALGLTNDARKGAGMVGIRLSENSEFGPTSEPFDGTNLIGTVINTDKLKTLKEGQIVYIREAKR
ncbi:methyl-coenzyme M reductase-associated protein Mmp3 [Methanosphaerula palustris]|uniref:UPF0288 protein Mpal_0254 n=1 Tax=Methanosphaerula palustris (strain ATCC BAA-1556 / DSM 19958 / E1-9c) TaxID=521011 RepID=B8GJ65_METPE|nr:methanogenesis marker 3 protein [Methanosphaerula palustris]ACL15638.1 methanogenesis marker protein 3 [Methanosphaerula palustris E1-9c]